MISLEYKESESTVYPDLIDMTSSDKTVYIRRNVKEVIKEDTMDDSNVTYYTYEEAKINKEDYSLLQQEQQRADIDYLAFMTGVDLEVSNDD